MMLVAMAIAALLSPVDAQASAREPNELYEGFAKAHAALGTAGLEPLYAPGATYLPRSRRFAIQTRDEILQRERASHDGMRANGGSIQLKFRISDRKRFGDLVVDNGYMRSIIRRSKSDPVIETTSKFILVMARQSDGRWALVSDADSDAPRQAYDALRPVPGLKYDK
jgi:ketosteroid isomerase-like protein